MNNRKTAVYRWFSKDGRLLYVGISVSVISRIYQHGQSGASWFSEVASCKVEHFESNEEACKEEKRAIENENPIYNVTYSTKRGERKVAGLSGRMRRTRGPGVEMRKAKEYFSENRNATAAEIAQNSGAHISTVYAASWWKSRGKEKNNI